MIDDFTLQLLAGGEYRCDARWSRVATQLDRCFKCYLPRSGEARLVMDDGAVVLRPGQVYLFDGNRLCRQDCAARMRVCWVHFAPASLYLQRCLEQAPALGAWPAKAAGDLDAMRAAPALFDPPHARESHAVAEPPVEAACRVQAFLLGLVARHLAHSPARNRGPGPRYERLRPAIRFMDRHFAEAPPLAAVAREAGQSAEHFHRAFKAMSGVTPFAYLLRLRMTRARRLLHEGLSVKETAAQCGYEDPLYFSRVFVRHFRQRPSACRREGLSG